MINGLVKYAGKVFDCSLVLCKDYGRWVHKRCTGIKANLRDAVKRCALRVDYTHVAPVRSEKGSIGDESLEWVADFC